MHDALRRRFAGLWLLPAFFLLFAFAAEAAGPLDNSTQMVLVTAPNWNATSGVLTRWERSGAASPWRRAGTPAPVLLGRNGLAWGRGLSPAGDAGPVKREGDGRAPAGAFLLPLAFGLEPPAARDSLPFHRLTPQTACVDDAADPHYNLIVEAPDGPPPWTSAEQMLAIQPQYRVGVVVGHNMPPSPGAGSCVFVHQVSPKGSPTAGCTALPAADLDDLVAWLAQSAHPVLVQLPEDEYAARVSAWGLPAALPIPLTAGSGTATKP